MHVLMNRNRWSADEEKTIYLCKGKSHGEGGSGRLNHETIEVEVESLSNDLDDLDRTFSTNNL